MQNNTITIPKPVLLLIVLVIVAALAATGRFILLRDGSTPAADDTEPSPTPVIDGEQPFDNDMSLAIDLIDLLNDGDRSNDNITDSLGRNNFLRVLASQFGSSGEIIGGALSTYAYYTEWYIGGYTNNIGWSKDTPWCASYVSWCLEQVNLSLTGTVPRYANVDNFMTYFFGETWLLAGTTPTPGDLVFFGQLNDPNHMGVVLAVEDGYIYTIEGNAADTVAIRKYTLTDSTILGYGALNWNN